MYYLEAKHIHRGNWQMYARNIQTRPETSNIRHSSNKSKYLL